MCLPNSMRYVPDLICLKIIKIKNFVIVNILEKPILNVILSCIGIIYIAHILNNFV